MGGSGLAFRMRWIHRKPGQNWDGAAPTGTMPLPIAEVRSATGWTIASYWYPPARRQPEGRHWRRVTAAIDNGMPVIGYEPKLNCAVIYGSDDFGRTLLMKDHYAGAGVGRYSTDQLPINFIFLDSWTEPEPAQAMLARVLAGAVASWEMKEFESNSSRFWMGETAYEKWLDDVSSVSDLTPGLLDRLFFVNWWTLTSLADARQAAATFLERHREALGPTGRNAFGRAAGHYRSMAKLGAQLIREKQIFRGRWTGTTRLEQWTDDVRSRERAIIEEMRRLDRAAIGELKTIVSRGGEADQLTN